jgi:SAM-dependent methyltransferase
VAKKNHYDDAISCDVLRGLPFPDETFDFVFTMDFFGHIEFKDKDRIIDEIHRVTKRGGYGFHGIETGFVDYFQCNPNDSEDPVRKYVYEEGHIGVEPLEAIIGRFGKKFDILYAYPFPLNPFLNIDNVMILGFWRQEFNAAIKPWINSNARVVFDDAMGYCNKYVLNMLIEIFGNVLTEEKLKGLNIRGLENLVRGCGFSFTLVQKVELYS